MSKVIDKWVYAPEGNAQQHRVIIRCPECNLRLGLTHSIADDGTISPSVLCTHDGCSYHEYAQLKGYPTATGLALESDGNT